VLGPRARPGCVGLSISSRLTTPTILICNINNETIKICSSCKQFSTVQWVVGDWGCQNKRLFPPKPCLPIGQRGPLSLAHLAPPPVTQTRTPPHRAQGRRGEARATFSQSRLSPETTAWPSHVLPTDRQTPPAGRVAPIPRWNARLIKSSKTIGEGVSRRRACESTAAPARGYQTGDLDGDRRGRFAINDDAVIRRW